MHLQKEVKYNFDFAVQLNRWSMRFCGLWPLDDRFSKLRYSLTLIFIFCMIVPLSIQCFILTNFFKEIETVLIYINVISTFCKVLFIGASKRKLNPLVKDMIVDWNDTPLSKESKNVMISNLKRAKMFNALCMILVYLPCAILLIKPMVGLGNNNTDKILQKSLPYGSYYPFDIQKSPNYELVYMSQIFFISLTVTAAMAINCFLTVIVFHLCGQLQIVALNVKYITNSKNVTHFRSMNRQQCKCLHCIVQRHIKLIRDAEIVESSFNIMILMEVVVTVLSLCMQGYAVLVVSPAKDISGTLISIVYFLAPTILVFLYCYIGENVIEKSVDIGNQIYDMNWYNCNPKLVCLLMMIIIRSQKQLELTAGKFFPMSLHAFKKILVSALSYATVLLASSRKHH